MESYRTHSKRLTATAAEKAVRLPETHPRHRTFLPESTIHHRSKIRSSWREEATKIRDLLPTITFPVEPLPPPIQQPWPSQPRKLNWDVATTLPPTAQHRRACLETLLHETEADVGEDLWSADVDHAIMEIDNNEQAQISQTAAKAIRTIDNHNAELIIYTDGSCTGGTVDGGTVIEVLQKRGGRYTCSYEEEKSALKQATDWLKANNPGAAVARPYCRRRQYVPTANRSWLAWQTTQLTPQASGGP